MSNAVQLHVQIHQNALAVVSRYRKTEAELIEVLNQVEQHRVYLHYGHASLFQYGVNELSLSENVVYSLITVMRKSRDVPELKTEIQNGNVNLSSARRIAAVITPENQKIWIEKASTLSLRELEKEVVKVRPLSSTPERASYVTESRIKLEVGLYEKDMMRLRHVQDLLSQARRTACSLEDVLLEMTAFYLKHHDPVEKAKRVFVKKGFIKKEVFKEEVIKKETAGKENLKTGEVQNDRSSTLATSSSGVSASESMPVSRSAVAPELTPASGPESALESASESVSEAVSEAESASGAAPVTKPVKDLTLVSTRATRIPVPAGILHQVNLRDQRACAFINSKGERCRQKRWLEIHHRVPVSQGGENSLTNLITLCSEHHRWIHFSGSEQSASPSSQ